MKNYDYNALKKLDSDASQKQSRGRLFEILINKLFRDAEILLRPSYHTSDNRSEQIDGAIKIDNRVVLLECKWVESNLAASSLYSFIGKVEGKLDGTIGLFISAIELSENFVNSVRSGRRPKVMLIHGNDLDQWLNDDKPKIDYIRYIMECMSIDNIVSISYASFVADLNIPTKAGTHASPNELMRDAIFAMDNKESDIEKMCLDHGAKLQMTFDNITSKYHEVFWIVARKYDNYNRVLDNLWYFIARYYELSKSRMSLLQQFLQNYMRITEPVGRYEDELLRKLTSEYGNLQKEHRKEFENVLSQKMHEILGWYDAENYMTDIIKVMYEYYCPKTQAYLLAIYIRIYISDRRDKYTQKQFSGELLNRDSELTSNTIKTVVSDLLKKRMEVHAKLWSEYDGEAIVSDVSRETIKLMQFVGSDTREKYRYYVKTLYDELLTVAVVNVLAVVSLPSD